LVDVLNAAINASVEAISVTYVSVYPPETVNRF